MYIISKKNDKDYYDGVAGTVGIDKTIIYERNQKLFIENNIPNVFLMSLWSDWRNPLYILKCYSPYGSNQQYTYFLIGFCGKTYIGFKIIEDNFIRITYDVNEIIAIFLQKNKNVKKFLIHYNDVLKINALKLSQEYKTPVWLYYDSKFIINPKLNDFEFFKVVDAFQAFQELSMFIGGVLGKEEKENIVLSNKDKILQHGFDYKLSFRKDKKILK